MQTIQTKQRRLFREIRQRIINVLNTISTTSTDDTYEDGRKQNRSLPPRRPPIPQVDLPPYQERDPYPITGYDDIPITVPIEGMVLPAQKP